MPLVDELLAIDTRLFAFINGFAGHNAALDQLVYVITGANLVKGMVPALIFWCLWFLPGFTDLRTRLKLIAVLVVAVMAAFVGRGIGLLLPFRDRPANNEGLAVFGPLAEGGFPENWSSFPSDHGVIYFAFAAGFFVISRRAGLVALLHAALVAALPRAYVGLHYPGDLIGGAMIGFLLGFTLVPLIARWGWLLRLLDTMLERYPFVLYPAIFFVTFNFASMFDEIRRFGSAVKNFLAL